MSTLENIKAWTEGHTEGPWRTWQHGSGPRDSGVETTWAHDGDEPKQITDWCFPADAELIAAAPNLLAALEAVGALHPRELGGTPDGGLADICSECQSYYPCTTMSAIAEALS